MDMADFADSFPSTGQVLRVLRALCRLEQLAKDTSGMQGSEASATGTATSLLPPSLLGKCIDVKVTLE